MAEPLVEEYRKLVEEIASCKRCPLSKHRKNPVPGEGPLNAKVMLIGEAPGKSEDETGRPFVGAAGALLTRLLSLAGLRREEVYITNIVKCRPPGNRDPTDEEIEKCTPFLWRQIRLIKPRVIVTLGRHAGRVIFTKAGLSWKSITVHRGKVYKGIIEGIEVWIIPTYHPAAALYKPPLREVLESDFSNVVTSLLRKLANKSSAIRQKSLFEFFTLKGDRG